MVKLGPLELERPSYEYLVLGHQKNVLEASTPERDRHVRLEG